MQTDQDKLKTFANVASLEDSQVPESEIDDSEDEDYADETTVVNSGKRPLWKRNEPKIVLAGICIALVGSVLYSLMKSGEQGLSNLGKSGQNSSQPIQAASPVTGKAEDPNQVAALKTQVALGTQAQELQKLNAKPSGMPTVKPTQIPVKAVSQPNPPTVSVPVREPYTDYVAAPPSIPSYTPSYTPSYAPPYQPPSSVPQSSETEPETDAKFVAYGRLPGRSSAGRSARIEADSSPEDRVVYASYGAEAKPRKNTLAAQQDAFLSGDRSFSVMPGTMVRGRVETPTVAEEGQEFLVRISDPINSSIGVIPKDSYASAQIDKLYGDGLLLASIRAIVTPSGQRYTLPDNTLRIMGSNDKPLIARAVRRGSGFGGIAASVALGALGNAAGLMNQPRTSISSNGAYMQDYGRVNMTSALVQGGVNAITPLIQSRQQAIQQQIEAPRDSVRYIQSGIKVKIQAL